MNGKQLRSTVRLSAHEHGGSVILRRLNTPIIMCDLHDISEMGCRCIARVRISDWSDTEKWRRLLCSGELYEAEITFDPYIPFIRLPIEIRSSIALPGNGYELGLAFFDLESDHRQMLNKAMLAIATEKIKQSKGVLKREESGARHRAVQVPLNSPLYPSPSIDLERASSAEWRAVRPQDAPAVTHHHSAQSTVFIPAVGTAAVAPEESGPHDAWIHPPQAYEPTTAQPASSVENFAGLEAQNSAGESRLEAFAREHRAETIEQEPAMQATERAVRAEERFIPASDAPYDRASPAASPAYAADTPRPRLSAFVRPHYEEQQAPGAQRIRHPAPHPHDDEMIDIPSHESEAPKIKFGEVLAKSGRLSRPEVHEAISSARHSGERLGEYLVRHGKLSPIEILQARSAQTGIAFVDLDASHIKTELFELFPFSRMKRDAFVPFEGEANIVRIAVANPLSQNTLAELSRITGRRIEQYLCREDLPREFLDSVARRFERYRRTHPRFKISLPMSFQCCPPEGPPLSSATFRGRTVDISEGGLQVSGPVILGLDPGNLSPGQLRMMVTIGAVPQDFVALCDTRHMRLMRGSGGGTSCVYGLKVDQMSQQHRDVLQGMLARVTRANSSFYSDTESAPQSKPAGDSGNYS